MSIADTAPMRRRWRNGLTEGRFRKTIARTRFANIANYRDRFPDEPEKRASARCFTDWIDHEWHEARERRFSISPFVRSSISFENMSSREPSDEVAWAFTKTTNLARQVNASAGSRIPFTARLDHRNHLPRLFCCSELSRSPDEDTPTCATMLKLVLNWSSFSYGY